MNSGDEGDAAHERALVNLYQELTGASESAARAVYMHVCSTRDVDPNPNGADEARAATEASFTATTLRPSEMESDSWANAALPAAAQT